MLKLYDERCAKNGGKDYRQNASYGDIQKADKLKEAVNIYSDDPVKDGESVGYRQNSGYNSNLKPEKPKFEKAAGFNRLETKHHQRHAKEMGFKNTKEYEKAAVEFFNSDRGDLYYSEKWGKYYRYDEKSHLLAVSSEGVIHTFWNRTKKEFERIRRQDKLNGV